MKIFSFGGGVQSTVAMVLQAQGKLDYEAFVFANVGDDSENPATLEYMRSVAIPYMEAHGIPFVEVSRGVATLYEYAVSNVRTVPIPVYMQTGAPGNRKCTEEFKVFAINKWLRRTNKGIPLEAHSIGIGFTLDEFHRIKTDRPKLPKKEYPLIEMRLTRAACHRIIADAGLPDPPKSSCWFCPFKSPKQWMTMRQEHPDLFAKACGLERRLNEKRASFGKDDIYLHPALMPLELAVADQPMLWDEMSVCESGFCFT